MPQPRNRRGFAPESLEPRLTLSGSTLATPPVAAEVRAATPAAPTAADVNGDGVVDRADLLAFAKAFKSHSTDAFYDPKIDFGHTGFISQQDGKFIERHLTSPPPNRPLAVYLRLAAGEQVLGHHPSNSGGSTYQKSVTIIGRTTPDALVFADSGQGNYTFDGAALIADAKGFFSFPVTNRQGINNYEFLAVDSYGHQTIRAFPVIWIKFFYSRHFHYNVNGSASTSATTPPSTSGQPQQTSS